MIQLLWPWVFVALPLPWLYRMLLRPVPNRDAALRVPDAGRFDLGMAARGRSTTTRRVLLALAWLAWVCLLGAIARPQCLHAASSMRRSPP